MTTAGDLLVSNGNNGCWPNEFGPTTVIYPLDVGKSPKAKPGQGICLFTGLSDGCLLHLTLALNGQPGFCQYPKLVDDMPTSSTRRGQSGCRGGEMIIFPGWLS